MDEWRDHFNLEVLGGTKERVLDMEDGGEEEHEGGGRRGSRRNIERRGEVIRKLKMDEATGKDGIENEAWRFIQKDVGEEFLKLINRIWKGKGILGDWNKDMISPIHKRGERNDPKNYR